MLFNSPIFLFVYLPLTLLGFFMAARVSPRWALAWLTAASLFFYGWWNPVWVPLLLASIAFNFMIGRELARRSDADRPAPGRWPAMTRKVLLIVAITANLLLLFHYKYSAFLLGNISALLSLSWAPQAGELPLGISFFTFTQIAFLVDAYQRKAADFDPVRYGLFVTYYPHLIAGPILHHKEMMPQFAQPDVFRFNAARLADGASIFMLGLFKKTVLADQFSVYASAGFNGAVDHSLTLYASWGAALSYTLQLYFDFSGYSDMAIGLAWMIGIRLPLNFHSPYKSLNIAEFWRRWHMTLSRFLRDYLYIPLGGNRRGPTRRYANLMLTMLLGGIWHGAGWTYVLWGLLHGCLLVVHAGWAHCKSRLGIAAVGPWQRPARVVAWLLTFVAVVVGWVFFRSNDVATAMSMLRAMAGANGALLPEQFLSMAPWLRLVADGAGTVPYLADNTVMGLIEMIVMLCIGMTLVLAAPAMHELSARWRYVLVVPCAALALQRVLYGQASEFLYFQF